MNSLTITVITALITAILGPILVEWTKVKFLTKKRSDILGESINTDEKIDHQLELIMEELLERLHNEYVQSQEYYHNLQQEELVWEELYIQESKH